MRDTVIVFARAPRLGTVKRRLARDIGERAALRLYVATLARLLRARARDRRFRTVVALTPDRARIALPARVGRIPQGQGGLGVRMHSACARYRRGRVVIIGSDIPHATAADVACAFRTLGHAQAVFGPAVDGGYWLVGLGPRRPARPFAAVRWSGPHALADTAANFSAHRVARLRMLRDIDTAEDLRAVVSRTPDARRPIPRPDPGGCQRAAACADVGNAHRPDPRPAEFGGAGDGGVRAPVARGTPRQPARRQPFGRSGA
jgi:rSAM/selenodomain-associated transferase 1